MSEVKTDKGRTNVTADELKKMSQVDPRTVDRDSLVDIGTVEIREDLPQMDRLLDFIRQIKNPYCYLDHGMVVKISFAGERRLEDCMMDCLLSE